MRREMTRPGGVQEFRTKTHNSDRFPINGFPIPLRGIRINYATCSYTDRRVRIPTQVERDFRKIVNDDPTMLNAISGRS